MSWVEYFYNTDSFAEWEKREEMYQAFKERLKSELDLKEEES